VSQSNTEKMKEEEFMVSWNMKQELGREMSTDHCNLNERSMVSMVSVNFEIINEYTKMKN
jgi:hypothetical protein